MRIQATYFVDRDYFLPYAIDNNRERSQDAKGYPRYGTVVKSDSVISDLFPRPAGRQAFGQAIHANYPAAADMLASVGFCCFQWPIEVELVRTASTRERLYTACAVPTLARSERELLVHRKSQIKKETVIVIALSGLEATRLPRPFQRIRRELMRLTSAVWHEVVAGGGAMVAGV